ncbi:MAG: hypothetical protein AAF990_22925 [Bacteroidota bacterium]
MNFLKHVYGNVNLQSYYGKATTLLLAVFLLTFSACDKEASMSPKDDGISAESAVSELRRDVETLQEQETNDADVIEMVREAELFDQQLNGWRSGRETSSRISIDDALMGMESILNLKLASGYVYEDEQFFVDSMDVPTTGELSGREVAEMYESIKTNLTRHQASMDGPNPGFRFVDITDVRDLGGGKGRVYTICNIGSVVMVEEIVRRHHGIVWGGEELLFNPPCTNPAEVLIATEFNFLAGGCFVGNPTFPNPSACGFFNIRSANVNPSGGTPGFPVPVDLIYTNRDFPTGETNAPLFPNRGEFTWHQDNSIDEICFNFSKTFRYVTDQFAVANGQILSDIRNLNFFTRRHQLIGETLLSDRVRLFNGSTPVVTYNAHLATIYYGRRFRRIHFPAVFSRELVAAQL